MKQISRFARPSVLAALYALALFIAGLYFHPILGMYCEFDDYVGQARGLTAGRLPYDVFHPLGYPALSAPFGLLFGDFFLGARLVSAVAGGLLVWSTYHFVRISWSVPAARLAALWIAVHPQVIVDALQATSDMMAAGTAMLVLFLTGLALQNRTRLVQFTLGLSFGLAYWTRYPAVALLIAIVPALAYAPGVGWRGRLARFLVFGGGAALALLPHCLLTIAQWGKPFHDENWRNLAMSNFGSTDGSANFHYLSTMPFDSWWSVLQHDPQAIASRSLQQMSRLFQSDLPRYLTGASAAGWVEWALYLCIPLGCVVVVLARRPVLLLGLAFALAYMLAISATFYLAERIMLLCLAPCIGAASSVSWVAGTSLRRVPRLRRSLELAITLAIVCYVGAHVPGRLAWLRSVEPHAELACIRRLVRTHGSDVAIGGVMGILTHHVQYRHQHISRYYGVTFPAPDFVAQMTSELEGSGTDFIVLGTATMEGADRIAALQQVTLPPWFAREHQDEQVLVWRVLFPTVEVHPNPYFSGMLRVDVGVPFGHESVRRIDLVATDPGGTAHVLEALPRSDRGAVLEVPSVPLTPGDWVLRARVQTPAGTIHSPAVTLSAR